MKTYTIFYTCLDTWISKQRTKTKSVEVPAVDEEQAIEWFEENIQMDFDDIEEETA